MSSPLPPCKSRSQRTIAQPNRRAFLGAAAAAGLGLGLSSGCQPHLQRFGRKPNVLLLWTDEQRADTMAAYGNEQIIAPNLDRLASQGALFEHAYVTQPVCTPNRGAVMTGFWPHQTGCTKNNIPLPASFRCLPEWLSDDYHTAYMGKWHLGDEVFRQHGFDEWVSIEDGYTAYYSADRDKSQRSDYHHYLAEQGYAPDGDGCFSRAFAARLPIDHGKPRFLQEQACRFLRTHRDSPFALVINFLEPHMPFFGPLDDMHEPAQVVLPASFDVEPDETMPLRYRVKREACIQQYGPGAHEYRALVGRYWGLVSTVDRAVGQILGTLEELGLAENTIVIFTSDHGDMMGAHKLVEKSVMYEPAVRVPWLMRIPGLKPRRISRPVSQIDLLPTLLDLLGHKRDISELPGKSLVGLLSGNPDDNGGDAFIQWNPDSGAVRVKQGGTDLATTAQIRHVRGEHSRCVITPDGWKLVLSDVDRCQLFNLHSDPGEIHNLYYQDQSNPVIARLKRKIRAWQESVNDSCIV